MKVSHKSEVSLIYIRSFRAAKGKVVRSYLKQTNKQSPKKQKQNKNRGVGEWKNHAERSSRLKGTEALPRDRKKVENCELSCHSSILRGKLSQVHSFDSGPGSKGKWAAFSMAFMAREASARVSLSPVCSVNGSYRSSGGKAGS